MKKLVKILLPFLVVNSAVFSGCKKNNNDNRVLLSFGDVHATESTEITIQKLNELVNAKENFLLVVSTNTCGCWNEFSPNLNSYLSKNKAICYKVDFNQIKDVASAYDLNLLSSSTTTFAIFENGKLKTSLCSSNDKNIMYDQTKFEKYMAENIKLPGCYYITEDDYNSLKNNKQNAVIYFERTACGDCTSINSGILRTYINNHPNANKIYVLDCQPHWKAKNDPNYQSYLDKKDELGISNVNNPYGFDAGVFPFFTLIENGEYASGAVVYNDTVDTNLVVTDSYYTTERAVQLSYTNEVIKGKQLTESDVNRIGDFVMWKQESADKVYEGILNSFLDFALPKSTFTF